MSIEKFSGSFSKEDNGCSIIINSTIQSILDPAALGVYCYLLTKPNTWVPNVHELMTHFNMSKDKTYRLIDYLINQRLLLREQKNQNGRFAIYEYTLFLRPRPDFPEAVPRPDFPEPEKPDAYKTKKLQNNDSVIKEISSVECASYPETLYPMPREASTQLSVSEIVSENEFNIPQQMIKDWVHARKTRRKPVTQTVWKRLNAELKKIKQQGRDPIDAFEMMVAQGWDSINANWKSQQKHTSNYTTIDHNDQSWRTPDGADLL